MKITQSPAVPSGVPGLDEVLGGGFPAGRMHLIVGETGTGKTTLALQFALEGRRAGEGVVFVTMAESEEELRANAASHGWSLDGIEIMELVPADRENGPDLPDSLFFPAEEELTGSFERLREAVDRLSPRRLVLDSISELKLMARERIYFRKHLAAFKRFCGGRGVTVVMTAEPEAGREDTRSFVHSLIRLEQNSAAYGDARRRLIVSKLRGSPSRSGYHDFTIETGGLSVYPRLAGDGHAPMHRDDTVSSGLPELDILLGGGVHRGTSLLLMGPAGVGKSTLGMSYAAAAAGRGGRALICLFEESIETLKLRSRIVDPGFGGFLESGAVMVREVDPSTTTMGQFSDMVRTAVEDDGIELVIIDTLNGLLHAMTETRLLELHIDHLIGFLGSRGVTTLLILAQHGFSLGESETPLDISYIADTVMLLRYFEAQGKILNAVSVIKKRTGGHEKTIREFRITDERIEIGEPLSAFQGVLSGNPRYVGALDRTLGHGDEGE